MQILNVSFITNNRHGSGSGSEERVNSGSGSEERANSGSGSEERANSGSGSEEGQILDPHRRMGKFWIRSGGGANYGHGSCTDFPDLDSSPQMAEQFEYSILTSS